MPTTLTKPRGLKRKCQNEDCAEHFYDLNRATFACPDCGTDFDLEAEARAVEAAAARGQSSRYGQRRVAPVIPIDQGPAEAADTETEDAETETEDDDASGSDVLLEEEEDADSNLPFSDIPAEETKDE